MNSMIDSAKEYLSSLTFTKLCKLLSHI